MDGGEPRFNPDKEPQPQEYCKSPVTMARAGPQEHKAGSGGIKAEEKSHKTNELCVGQCARFLGRAPTYLNSKILTVPQERLPKGTPLHLIHGQSQRAKSLNALGISNDERGINTQCSYFLSVFAGTFAMWLKWKAEENV